MKHLLLVTLCLSLVLEAQAARISCGTEFKVVVKNDGSVWSWGDNSRGQLGLGYSGGSVSSPAVVPGLQNVVSVAAGDSTVVALKSDGTVWQWGLNPGLTTFTPTPTLVTGIANVVQIDAGLSHVLAIRNDGSVWAWGSNSTGMLGDGTTIAKTSPVAVSNLNNMIAVAAGGQFSMALSATGLVYVWGSNLYGQSGNGVASSVNQLSPVLVTSLSSIVSISAGRDHCLASNTNGLAYAWGRSHQGQIGIGSTSLTTVNVPTHVASLVAVSKVCAGANNSVAILNNNTTWGWGQNASGTLGLGDASLKVSPQRITTLDNALEFDTGANSSERFAHSIALTNNEMCWSWGENATGQRGFGTLGSAGSTRSSSMEVTSLNNVRFLAAYTDSSMAIDQAANVISWGSVNGGPQLKTEAFPQVANLKKFVTGVQGPRCFLLNDQSLWTWGGAALGMLGTGEPLTNAAVPIAVPGMTNITDVSVGNNHVIALKQNGDIWTWGYNFSGVLGSLGIGSSQFYHASPVLISGVNQVKKIAAGSTHSLVLKQDGTLWAWGKNTTRALGDGTSINRTTPVLSHTIPNVQEIAVGSDISLALKTDGTVWTWGSTAQPAPPTQVPGLTGIVKIGARLNCRYAITESGSLWVWGDNANGQLGDGTTTNRTQPVKVMDYVASVDMSGNHTLVLKEDGNVSAFGLGASGQLCEGIVANSLLPLPLLSLGAAQPTVQMVNPPNSSQLNVAGTYNFQINQTSNLETPLAKVSVYHERALLTVDETPPFDFNFEPWTWGKFQFNCQAIDTTGKYSTFTIGSPVTVLYDSDNDQLPDWWELKYWPSLLTEHSLADTDGDRLNNLEEYKKGLQPNNSDTDGDSQPDGREIAYGFNPLVADVNPTDSDNDGLPDWWEQLFFPATSQPFASPNPNDDPDYDWLTNSEEYKNGTNPRNGSDGLEFALEGQRSRGFAEQNGFGSFVIENPTRAFKVSQRRILGNTDFALEDSEEVEGLDSEGLPITYTLTYKANSSDSLAIITTRIKTHPIITGQLLETENTSLDALRILEDSSETASRAGSYFYSLSSSLHGDLVIEQILPVSSNGPPALATKTIFRKGQPLEVQTSFFGPYHGPVESSAGTFLQPIITYDNTATLMGTYTSSTSTTSGQGSDFQSDVTEISEEITQSAVFSALAGDIRPYPPAEQGYSPGKFIRNSASSSALLSLSAETCRYRYVLKSKTGAPLTLDSPKYLFWAEEYNPDGETLPTVIVQSRHATLNLGESTPEYTLDARLHSTNHGGEHRVLGPLRIDISWEAKPEFANVDDNPDPWTNKTNGKRIFPDIDIVKGNPSGLMRREVNVKIHIPGYANKTIYLKAFDPDDPSLINDPLKVLDPNDEKGDDNIKGAGLISEWGYFPRTLTRNVELTTDGDGRATEVFKVNQQPGNNYRVAVAFQSEDLDFLNVSSPSAQGFIYANDAPVTGFNGSISPLLTVWRKLNIEVDSMQAFTPPKPAPDRASSIGTTWGTNPYPPFYQVLQLSSPVSGVEDFYTGGKIKAGNFELEVVYSDSSSITLKSLIISPEEKAAFQGVIEVFDDDDTGLGHPLPRANLITQGVKEKYKYAYIDIVQRTINPSPTIPFELYSATLILNPFGDPFIVPSAASNNGFDTSADDEPGFWNHYIVAQYQGTKDESGDPFGGGYGVTPGQTFWGGAVNPEFSAVYLEVVREVAVQQSKEYQDVLNKVVAHEIGHAPGRISGHPEEGLMADGAPEENFSAESLRRFRKTAHWEGSW